MGDLVKQSRPGQHQQEVELVAFPEDNKLCTVARQTEYKMRTEQVCNGETGLLISYTKPHASVKGYNFEMGKNYAGLKRQENVYTAWHFGCICITSEQGASASDYNYENGRMGRNLHFQMFVRLV